MYIDGLKKTPEELQKSFQHFNMKTYEVDELYWFIGKKARTETRENIYVIAMVSREPRQIVSFDVSINKSTAHLQRVVDNAPWAENYCTDGYFGYLDVVFPGKHIRNVRDKRDTHIVESVNADLRHYIPVLARRSRCFCRTLETLDAVVSVFVDAYNKFGEAKLKCRIPTKHKSQNHAKHLHKFRELPFSVLDFL